MKTLSSISHIIFRIRAKILLLKWTNIYKVLIYWHFGNSWTLPIVYLVVYYKSIIKVNYVDIWTINIKKKGRWVLKKITDFIVKRRNAIIILFIVLSVISVFLSKKVKIIYDMAEYLPADSETRIGMDIMDEEFEEEETSSLNVMFKDLSEEEKNNICDSLKKIEGVSSVDYEKNNKDYNKDGYTLYILNVDEAEDSETAKSVYNFVNENFKDYNCAMSRRYCK